MQTKTKIILVAIFLLALILRFWKLDIYPEAVDEDEMALGYYAYSLIHGGIDEYGHKFPIYFESAGDYKYGLYSYIDTIPVAIFGLNPTTTRSIAAVAGSLSVIAIFFLAYEIYRNDKFALLAAFTLAINPTHIHFSRVAYNNILGAFFAIVCIVLYLKWIKGNKHIYAIWSFLAFLLAIFSYQAYRVFIPVTFVFLPIFLYKNIKVKKIYAVVFSLLILAATFLSFIPPESRARSQSIVSLVNQPMLMEEISEDGLAKVPLIVTRVFDNKVVNFTFGFTARYVSYFDPNFLFVATTTGTERHSTPNVGLFYLIEAPFFLIGLMYLTKYIPDNKKFIPLVILFAGPLAAASVIEPVSTTRAVMLVVGYSLIISLGIFTLLNLNKKFSKIICVIIMACYLTNFLYFFHEYTVHKIYHHPWYSDVGLKEMVADVDKLGSRYKNIVMSGGHYIPYLFYNKVLPQDFIANSEFNSLAQANGVRVKRFGKIIFNMPYDCPTAGKLNVLYVCFGYKVPKKANLVDVIRYKDGQPAIELVDFTGEASIGNLPEKLEYSSDVDNRFPNGIIPETYATNWPAQ